jgi:hypothetical protein
MARVAKTAKAAKALTIVIRFMDDLLFSHYSEDEEDFICVLLTD